jgi:hypothetical protein
VVAKLAADERFGRIYDDPYVLHLGLFEAGTVIDPAHQTAWRRLYRRLVYAGAFAHWRWETGALRAFTGPLADGARNKLMLFRLVSESVGKGILIDSSKHYLEATALYHAAPRNTKVLLLVRDGRAVLYSGLKRGYARRKALNAWRHTYSRAVPVLARQIDGKNLLRVRYEDLVANPAQELHRICGFIGVGFDVGMLDFRSRAHHVLNGNDMRLARSGTIRMDEAWKSKLTTEDLHYFETRAGQLNRDLGYSG